MYLMRLLILLLGAFVAVSHGLDLVRADIEGDYIYINIYIYDVRAAEGSELK